MLDEAATALGSKTSTGEPRCFFAEMVLTRLVCPAFALWDCFVLRAARFLAVLLLACCLIPLVWVVAVFTRSDFRFTIDLARWEEVRFALDRETTFALVRLALADVFLLLVFVAACVRVRVFDFTFVEVCVFACVAVRARRKCVFFFAPMLATVAWTAAGASHAATATATTHSSTRVDIVRWNAVDLVSELQVPETYVHIVFVVDGGFGKEDSHLGRDDFGSGQASNGTPMWLRQRDCVQRWIQRNSL